jgi:hypothetical protein
MELDQSGLLIADRLEGFDEEGVQVDVAEGFVEGGVVLEVRVVEVYHMFIRDYKGGDKNRSLVFEEG